MVKDIDRNGDYYIYFYFHALSLLNPKGTFCFITSNSWLDAEYGKDLQEFLLKYVPIYALYDNPKRSFAHADINTIIALFGAPKANGERQFRYWRDQKEMWPCLGNVAKFVMFKKSFEETLSARNLCDIDKLDAKVRNAEITELVKNVAKTTDYRAFPIAQEDLLEDGWGYPEEYDSKRGRFRIGQYEGNKWGAKYLRAPEIFFTILEKGKALTRSMSEFFEGERYLNTGGADDFFILTDVSGTKNGLRRVRNKSTAQKAKSIFEGFVEGDYLVPLVKDYTREKRTIEIGGFDAYCFVCPDGKKELKQKEAYEYVKWGESQGYHLRSVTKTQNPWYKPTRQMLNGGKVLVPRSFNDTYIIHYNPKAYLSLRYYRLHPKKETVEVLVAFLNSTYIAFLIETLGNRNLGQGVLNFFMGDFLKLRIPFISDARLVRIFEKMRGRAIQPIWEELGIDPERPIREQNPKPVPDRKVLDDLIFDKIGLTDDERKEVYWSVCELVKQRLDKAQSLKEEEDS